MKIKIISDGQNHAIVDADTGTALEGVRIATIQLKEGENACVLLEMDNVPVEVRAHATFDSWFKIFKFKAHVNGLNVNNRYNLVYVDYFNKGLTPKEAVAEELNVKR